MGALWLDEFEGEVLQRIASAKRVFCFVDYDGTFTPLAPTPDQARPLPGSVELLRALAHAPGTQVAVVSGRAVAAVRRMIDVEGIYYIGIHGLEVGFPNGATEFSEGVALVRSIFPAIRQRLRERLDSLEGIYLEDKGVALACHYRLASAPDAEVACEAVSAISHAYQRRGVKIAVRRGPDVVEIRPAYANKGRTACELLAPPSPRQLAIYLGDDQSDEDAFALLPSDAITVRVGSESEPTCARHRLRDAHDVHRFLRHVVESRRGQIARSA